MLQIKVLLENSTVSNDFLYAHGLSIYIKTKNQKLLLDVGPNSFFAKNAEKLDVPLNEIDTLIFSHAHFDHTKGLNAFCKANKTARILMMDNKENGYVSKHKILKVDIGLKGRAKNLNRIQKLKKSENFCPDCSFIPCTVNTFGKPAKNQSLYMKKNRELFPDDFTHEGILVIEDEGQLVIFNSCSHNGVINSIESVRKIYPGKEIRSYIGGFHFPYRNSEKINPIDLRNLEEFVEYANIQSGIKFYTGHCTFPQVIDYLEEKLGKSRIQRLHTGLSIEV